MFTCWNLWNHSITGAISTHDIIDGIAYPWHEQGIQNFACKEAFLLPPWINVLFENFTEEWQVDVMRAARNAGCRFVLVVTEMPGKSGFNSGWHQSLKLRMQHLAEIIKNIDVVICLCPGAAARIKEWIGHPACVDAELGWSETFYRYVNQKISLARVVQRQRTDYDPKTETRWIDVGFYGPLTKHRVEVLERFKKKKFLIHGEGTVLEQAPRDFMLSQFKVSINLKAETWTQPVSSSRLLRSLQLGCAAFSEPVNGASIWKTKKIAHFATKHANLLNEGAEVVKHHAEVCAEQQKLAREYLSSEAMLGHTVRLMRETMPECTHVNGGVPEMKFIQIFSEAPQVGALSLAA